MAYPIDPRRDEAAAMPMDEIIDRLGLAGLQRAGREMVGPCPICGGRDRFGINIDKGVFQCRRCDGKGGGVALVMFVMGMDYPAALNWMCGPVEGISDAERKLRAERAAQNKARNDAIAEKKRAEAMADARRIWEEGKPAEGSPVRDYLALRGISPALLPRLPICLRYHPSLPFMHLVDRDWVQVHRGPCMLAAVQGPDDRFSAVHRTYLNLNDPKGKAKLVHPVTREPLPSKKLLGHKKGGTIRLTPPAPTGVLVMAEGIETTLSARVADAIPGAAYWAGVDLGNMAGRAKRCEGLKYAGIPDFADDQAFVPPAWVRRLIFVQDGDSDARDTRAKLLAGLRRAKGLRPSLIVQIVHAGKGVDLNDVLLGSGADG